MKQRGQNEVSKQTLQSAHEPPVEYVCSKHFIWSGGLLLELMKTTRSSFTSSYVTVDGMQIQSDFFNWKAAVSAMGYRLNINYIWNMLDIFSPLENSFLPLIWVMLGVKSEKATLWVKRRDK